MALNKKGYVMQVNSIGSTQKFTSEYGSNETNAGKCIGLGVAGGLIAQKMINKGGLSEYAQDYHDELAKSLTKELSTNGRSYKIEKLTTPLLKRMANMNFMGSLGIIAICSLGAGAIFDAIVNSMRRN